LRKDRAFKYPLVALRVRWLATFALEKRPGFLPARWHLRKARFFFPPLTPKSTPKTSLRDQLSKRDPPADFSAKNLVWHIATFLI